MNIWDTSKIKAARTMADLNVKNAAKAINITPEYLSMIENGHREPSHKVISRMSEAYGVPISSFLISQKNLAPT
jgi:transcriptional regulator with XRE-family HTH domain